jgi:hypothetical protein
MVDEMLSLLSAEVCIIHSGPRIISKCAGFILRRGIYCFVGEEMQVTDFGNCEHYTTGGNKWRSDKRFSILFFLVLKLLF